MTPIAGARSWSENRHTPAPYRRAFLGAGRRRRFRATAFSATSTLDPDIVRAPEQGWGSTETVLTGAGGLLALALSSPRNKRAASR